MKLLIKKGTTDKTLLLFIQSSALTTGGGLTGLVYNTASLVAYYARPGASPASITLATQTVAGAHSDGGFVAVDGTNMPGVYRFDLPDAVIATGVDEVVVMLHGAANMAPVVLEIQLTGVDVNDATGMGISRLDAEITSRLASASYTAPANSDITAIKAKTDQLAFTSGAVDSNVERIDGGAVDGYNATLKLKALEVNNDAGDAVSLLSSGGGGNGLAVEGNGSGNGIQVYGGATGNGVLFATGGTGRGFVAQGGGGQPDIYAPTNTLQISDLAAGAAADVTSAVLDDVVEGSYSLRQLVRGFFSALLGKSSGHTTGGASAPKYRDVADAKNRIDAVTDADGNRSSVTLDLT